MESFFGLDNENGNGTEREKDPREGTRLTPSEFEAIYFALQRIGIDPEEEEARALTKGEWHAINAEELDKEGATHLCHSIMEGIKLQKAFELAFIMFIARAHNSELDSFSYGSPGYDPSRYLQPQPWMINALYPTRKGHDKEVMMEAYASAAATEVGRGQPGHLDMLKRVFIEWHSRHVFYKKPTKRRNGSDGTILSAEDVELLWNTPAIMRPDQLAAVRAGDFTVFPMLESDFETILDLVNAMFYYRIDSTAEISDYLRRAVSLRHISFEPSAQISIHRNGGDRDESNTILARTDLALSGSFVPGNGNGKRVVPLTTLLVDIKTGRQMEPEKLLSRLGRVTALSYALTYHFTRETFEGSIGTIPRRIISEEEVFAFIADVSERAFPGHGPRLRRPGALLRYLHLPTGQSRNVFPGVFLNPSLYADLGRDPEPEDVRRELMRTYTLMTKLYDFARLNKNGHRFWKRDQAPFVIPRPLPSTAREVGYQPTLGL